MDIDNEIIQNSFIERETPDPNGVQYTSQAVYENRFFAQGDFISLSGLQVKNLYENSGSITYINIDNPADTKTFQLPTVNNYNDVIAAFNNQLWPLKLNTNIQLGTNQQFTHFSINIPNPAQNAQNYTIDVTGNSRCILGIYKQITVDIGGIELSKNNSMRIQYLKFVCDRVDASLQTYKDTPSGQVTEFEAGVLMIVSFQNGFRFAQKAMDVHMKLVQNGPYVFKLVDQDNIPCSLGWFYAEVQLYNKSVFREKGESESQSGKLELHLKRQLFVRLQPDNPYIIHLPVQISEIAVANASGDVSNLIFTQANSYVKCRSGGDQKNINLYNSTAFAAYRNKFIDSNFLKIFGDVFKAFLTVSDITQNSVTITTLIDPMVIEVQEGNILRNLLFENPTFTFTGQNVNQPVIYTINSEKTFRYSNNIYIRVKQSDKLLDVLIGEDIVLRPLNNQVFVWKQLTHESQQLEFEITQRIDTGDKIIFEEATDQELFIRLLVK